MRISELPDSSELLHIVLEDYLDPTQSKPPATHYLLCVREGHPMVPMICAYHAETGNFYQVHHEIHAKKTILRYAIVRDVIAYKVLESFAPT